jgi:hypothetical protein
MALTSPRFAGNARLQAASNNSPAMHKNEAEHDAVRILQKALVDLGFPLPLSTRRDGTLDGIYGDEVFIAVQKFQIKFGLLGKNGQPDGIVGKQTMSKLDDLFKGGAPVPLTDQQIMDNARTLSNAALSQAILALKSLETTLISPSSAVTQALLFLHQGTLDALQRWLKISRSDSDFVDNLRKARSLMEKNLATTATIVHQPSTGPDCKNGGFAWSNVGDPSQGVRCCDAFFLGPDAGSNKPIGPLCQMDVITHEFFHLVGLHEQSNTTRATITTAQALDCADNMAQLVAEITAGPHRDSCLTGK